MPKGKTCARCGCWHRRVVGTGQNQRMASYCRACHNEWMRLYRPRYRDLSPEQRRKAICRSAANVALKRGLIEREPCEGCGAARAQMHHDDYSQPKLVRWLCTDCHLEHHAQER